MIVVFICLTVRYDILGPAFLERFRKSDDVAANVHLFSEEVLIRPPALSFPFSVVAR
jgi:hypothetical protein